MCRRGQQAGILSIPRHCWLWANGPHEREPTSYCTGEPAADDRDVKLGIALLAARLPPYTYHGALVQFCSGTAALKRVCSSSHPRRQQSGDPQPDFLAALAHRAANSEHNASSQDWFAGSEDIDACLHGMRCGTRAITMGESAHSDPGQNRSHEGCSRSILASRDSWKQPSIGAR